MNGRVFLCITSLPHLRAQTTSHHRQNSNDNQTMMEHDSQEIRLCALVLAIVAFFLFIAAEIVHEEQSAPSRGVLLLVAIGTLAFAWIGPLTLLAGTLRSKAFQWWQPFRGGAEFVWMQAFGWFLHTFVLTGAVVVVANAQVHKWFQGQYLLLGAMGFMAQILLNLSIGCFREVVGEETNQRAFQFPLTTKAVVSLLVSASGTLMFVCYDLFSHLGQSPVMVALGCIEFIVSALVIHVLYGCGEIPGFRIWQPFEGEKTFLLLQYLGWQLFAFTIGGALNVFFSAEGQSGYESSKGTGTAIGAMGMMSQVLLLVSLQYFDGSSVKAERRSLGEEQQDEENTTFASGQDATTKRKRPAEVYVASLLCIGALGVGCLSHAAKAKIDVLPRTAVQFFLAHEKVGWIISLSSLAIAAPIANMGGVRSKPAYLWWQPFQGGTKFVFLQTIGWLWYGFYLALAIVLCMNSSKFGDVAACLVLIVGSGGAGAIAMSLPYFQSSKSPKSVDDNGRVRHAYWCDVIKGEVTMVMLLSLSSTLFHLLIDYFQDQMLPSIRAFCLMLAMALFILASTVSHLSGRKLYSRFRLWQPFEGGDQYVIRQAVGWALVGVQLLFDSLLLTLVSQAVPFGVLSLLGAFAVAPQALILSSVQYFQPSQANANGPDAQAKRTPCVNGWQDRSWRALMQDSTLRWHASSNVFVVFGSLCLFVSAEILGSNGLSFQRAEEVLYLFGCLLSSYGIAFTHCILGPKVHPTYRVFQPFRGGIKFITFHGAAWTVASVAWALSMTAIYWSSVFFEITGIHLLTGLLYIVPQSILFYSISLFRPTDEQIGSGVKGKERQSGQNLKAEDLANQFFVGRLVGFAGCAVFVLVDLAMVRWGPSIPVFPMTASAVLALFSSIPLSYKFASSNYGTKAKSIGGGIVFVVLGCALWSFTLLLGGLFSYNLWKTQHVSFAVTSVSEPTKYLGTFTGSVGFTAQLLFFQASESSHFKSELGIKLPLEEKLFITVSNLKKHLAFASIWVYSSVPLVAGLLYAHTKSVLPKHLATSQILVLLFCSAVVIWSAWWIQQQIVSTGCAYLPHNGARKLQAKASASVTEALTPSIPILDIGLDCYVQIAAFLTISELVICSTTSKGLSRLHSEDFWRLVFVKRFFASRAKQSQQLPAKCLASLGTPSSSLPTAIAIGANPFAATTLNRVESAAVNLICRLKCVPSYNAPKRLATVNM